MKKLLIAIIGVSLAFGTTSAFAEEAKKEKKAQPAEIVKLRKELMKKVKAGDLTKEEMKKQIKAKMKELKGAKGKKNKKKEEA